jgi:hypothetical protein
VASEHAGTCSVETVQVGQGALSIEQFFRQLGSGAYIS